MSPQAAAALGEIMRYSVEAGWAASGGIAGITVGGKTGSAEVVVEQNPHAVYIGYAEHDGRAIAVTMVKEFAGSGSAQAAPAARDVIQAWIDASARQAVNQE